MSRKRYHTLVVFFVGFNHRTKTTRQSIWTTIWVGNHTLVTIHYLITIPHDFKKVSKLFWHRGVWKVRDFGLGRNGQSLWVFNLGWVHHNDLYHSIGNSPAQLSVKFWAHAPSRLDATASQSQDGRPVKRFFARSSFISTRIVNLTGGKPKALNKTFLTQFTDWKSAQPFSRYLRKSVEILTKIPI